MKAYPSIEYAQFNTAQEGLVGADWLWWFLDDSGECFGVLVQAKRLIRRGAGWSIDIRLSTERNDTGGRTGPCLLGLWRTLAQLSSACLTFRTTSMNAGGIEA